MSRAHARAQPDRPGCYGRVHASVPTALVDLVENSAARTTRGCAPTTRRWPGRLASSQRELRCALGRCQVLGLSCRWLDGAVRQQCAGHLPFERQARANGSFPILPTGSTDPLLPSVSVRSGHSTSEFSGRRTQSAAMKGWASLHRTTYCPKPAPDGGVFNRGSARPMSPTPTLEFVEIVATLSSSFGGHGFPLQERICLHSCGVSLQIPFRLNSLSRSGLTPIT